MCRDSVCTVQSATLHYFLCVLLNLFMPELAPVSDPCAQHRLGPAEPSQDSIHLYLSAVTSQPSTANLLQQHGAIRGTEQGREEREQTEEAIKQVKQGEKTRRIKNRENRRSRGAIEREQYLKPKQTDAQSSSSRIHLKSLIVCCCSPLVKQHRVEDGNRCYRLISSEQPTVLLCLLIYSC